MRSLGSNGVRIVIAPTALMSSALPAHHSTAMFDQSKTVVVMGTVRTWQWTNPHAWLWLAMPAANGRSVDYGIELGALSMLRCGGLTKDSFAPGGKISVTVHPLINGQPGGMFISAEVGGKTIKPIRP